MKSLTRELDFQSSSRFVFQKKQDRRDVLKGSEIEQERLDLANEMKAMTQSLSDDVLASLPNEKNLELVNPQAIHDFVNKHLKGEIGFDEAEIKKVVVKRRNGKMTLKIKRKGLQNDIIIKINDKKDKVKVKERRKGKDLKIKYKKEEFRKEQQPIHSDIDFSMTVDEYKKSKEVKKDNKDVVVDTNKKTTNLDNNKKKETVEVLPEIEQNELYNDLKGKINAISIPSLDKALSNSASLDTAQAEINALQAELNSGKPKMTPERGAELQKLLDGKQADLTEVKNMAEVYGTGEKEVKRQDEISKKQTEDLNKKIEKQVSDMEKKFEAQTKELQALSENQKDSFDAVKNGFDLIDTNFETNNLNTREGVSLEFMKYQQAAASFGMEANVLEAGAMEMQKKYVEFEEEKNEMSWKNAGKFATGLLTTVTFVSPLYDWGAKLLGSKKTLNSSIWQENDDVAGLNKDKEDFLSGFDVMQKKLDTKKQAIDAHGVALNNAVENTLPDNVEKQKAQQFQAVENVMSQTEKKLGVELPKDKIAALKKDLEQKIENSEGKANEELGKAIGPGTKEIAEGMTATFDQLSEYPEAFKDVEFQPNDGWQSTLGFLGKGIASAGDWMVEGSKDGWPVFAQIGGGLGGVVRGVGNLVDGVGTALSNPVRLVNGVVGLLGVDFLQEGADEWKFSEMASWDRLTGTWGNLFKGFFAAEAWKEGEHSAAVGESIFNVVATIFTSGGAGAVRGGSILSKTFRVAQRATGGRTGLSILKTVGKVSKVFVKGGSKAVGRVGGNLLNRVRGINPRAGLKNLAKKGRMGLKNIKNIKSPKKVVGGLIERGKNVFKKKPKSVADQLTKVDDALLKANEKLAKLESSTPKPFLRKRTKLKKHKNEIRDLKNKIKDLERQRGDLAGSYASAELKSFSKMKTGGKEFEIMENGNRVSYRFHNENWQKLSSKNGKWLHYDGPTSKLQTRLRQQIQLENGIISKSDVLYKSTGPSRVSRLIDKLPKFKRPSLKAFCERASKALEGLNKHWPYIIVPAILGNKEFVDAKSRRILEMFIEKDLSEGNEIVPLTSENIEFTKKTIKASGEAIGYWEGYIMELRNTLPPEQQVAADELQALVDEIKPEFERVKSKFEESEDGSVDQAAYAQALQLIVIEMEAVNKAFMIAAGGNT